MDTESGKSTMAFVTGGSGGFGKAIAKLLASQGADVTIFGCTKPDLEAAAEDIRQSCRKDVQNIQPVVLDLSKHSQVETAFRAHDQIPDTLYCAAGGSHAQIGFLLDITAEKIGDCMQNNYYATAYPVKAVLDIWVRNDESHGWEKGTQTQVRRIVIVNSAAAFVGISGLIGYTTAKVAVRALADTLRLEMMRYSSQRSTYTVHIAYPGDFVSPGFYQEQLTKTPLTKRMQGLEGTLDDLVARYPSSEKMASLCR